MGKTIGIISIKGGVGKTSVVSSLGASLVKLGKKVLVIDGNFTAPNLGLHIGFVNPETTIQDVLNGKTNAKEALYSTEYGFDILAGALVYEGKINPLGLGEKIRELKRKYDVILIDSSPNLNDEMLATMMASDELLVVTTPDHVTLSATLRAIKLAKEKRTPISGLVLNKVYDKDFEISLKQIEETAGVNVLAVIPHEVQMLEALSENMPATLYKKNNATVEYDKLASSLIGENFKGSKLKNFFRNIFHAEVPKQEVNRDIFRNNRASNPFYS